MDSPKILILSTEDDGTTDRVIRWIKYFGGKFDRFNDTSPIIFKNLEIAPNQDEVVLQFQDRTLKISDYDAYWYRRGRLNLQHPEITGLNGQTALDCSIYETLKNEYDYILNYIYHYFQTGCRRTIGSIFDNSTNKLSNLISAKEAGLKVPITRVVTTKLQLIAFLNEYERALVKPVYQRGFYYEDDFEFTTGLSAVIQPNDIDDFPDNFAPTLIQTYIEKKIELRIFYLQGKCFTSAIFSQLDEKTKIDFRNYNWEKPNRTPPFTLPNSIASKIDNFMKRVKMNSGSLDVILTPSNEYVFLEVNPVGQFWQVSYPCNFYLEKKIAKYLCYK